MDRRRTVFVAIMLVLVGAGLGWIVVVPALRKGELAGVQVRQDAISLTHSLRYGYELNDVALREVDTAWNKRKSVYDRDMLDRLARTLNAFVDFQEAQWADAKDIYVNGRLPDRLSEHARAANARLREWFGDEAETMISQYRERVLEEAYKASPKVASGVEPETMHFGTEHDDLVTKWLPQARQRVAELTSPSP